MKMVSYAETFSEYCSKKKSEQQSNLHVDRESMLKIQTVCVVLFYIASLKT
jgi:hypothetical protein